MHNLGLSPFLSKGLKQVLVEWLVPYVISLEVEKSVVGITIMIDVEWLQ